MFCLTLGGNIKSLVKETDNHQDNNDNNETTSKLLCCGCNCFLLQLACFFFLITHFIFLLY